MKYRSIALALTLLSFTNLAVATSQDFRMRAHQTTLNQVTESDVTAEIKFGQGVAARILGRIKLDDDEQLNRYVNLVGKSIARLSNRPELDFRFAVLDADFANAYSAPGGYVFITRGAIDLAEDESELAAVLAHEVAHISEKHIVKSLNIKGKDDSDIGGVVRILGGGKDSASGAFFQALDKAVDVLFKTGYKHEDEVQADSVAISLLAANQYDIKALKRYLQRAEKNNSTETQTTHPAGVTRYRAIDRFIKEEGLSHFKGAKAKTRFKRYVGK